MAAPQRPAQEKKTRRGKGWVLLTGVLWGQSSLLREGEEPHVSRGIRSRAVNVWYRNLFKETKCRTLFLA